MNALLQGLLPASGDSPLAPAPRPTIQKLRYEHRAMAQLIASNPCISQNELSEVFGYSASWISTIISSDIFQAILAEEMEKSPFGKEYRATAEVQLKGLLSRSMEVLRRKLDAEPEKIPDQLALQTAKMAASALDLGAQKRASVHETHIHLDALASNLVGLLRREKTRALEYSNAVETSPVPGHAESLEAAAPGE